MMKPGAFSLRVLVVCVMALALGAAPLCAQFQLLSVSSAYTAVPASVPASDAATGAGATLGPTVTAAIDALFAPFDNGGAVPGGARTPGCAVGVIKDGALIYERYFGHGDVSSGTRLSADSLFEIASESKQFTGAAIGLLAMRGQVNLDAPVRRYLPELAETRATVRELLYHISGFNTDVYGFANGGNAAYTLGRIARTRATAPGTTYAYSNTGYFLLGQVVARVSRQSFARFCRENLFDPLGMRDTYQDDGLTPALEARRAKSYMISTGGDPRLPVAFSNQPVIRNGVIGHGGVLTNLRDLTRWDANFYANRLGDGTADRSDDDRPLGLIEALTRPGRYTAGAQLGRLISVSADGNYGFGLEVGTYQGRAYQWHTGSNTGFKSVMLRYPAEHLTVIILSNAGDFYEQQHPSQWNAANGIARMVRTDLARTDLAR